MIKDLIYTLKLAGEILHANFEKKQKIEIKENQCSIVTETDKLAESAIIKNIQKKYPNHNILSEEIGYIDKNSEYTWIIDPLDGTSNFAAGIPWFGILIAVLKNNEPILSGAYLPIQKELYFAEKGKGAFKNNKPISVSQEENLENVLFAYSLDYSENNEKTTQESKMIKNLVQNVRNIRATNSLLDFLYTAEGKFGGNINQTTKIWDIASPALIIEEAGGKVTDITGNKLNFTINNATINKNFTIIASNKLLHHKILKII